MPVCRPTSSAWEYLSAHTLPMRLLADLRTVASLQGEQWYVGVILVHIFLMSQVWFLFMHFYRPIYISFFMKYILCSVSCPIFWSYSYRFILFIREISPSILITHKMLCGSPWIGCIVINSPQTACMWGNWSSSMILWENFLPSVSQYYAL